MRDIRVLATKVTTPRSIWLHSRGLELAMDTRVLSSPGTERTAMKPSTCPTSAASAMNRRLIEFGTHCTSRQKKPSPPFINSWAMGSKKKAREPK